MNVNASTTAGAQVALSILTRGGVAASPNLVAPVAVPVARAESPAVIIDLRIEELVGKQAEAADAESGGAGDTVAARRQRFEWMRGMVEGAELSVTQLQQTIETARTTVDLYEKTGQLYQRSAQGKFEAFIPKDGWKPGDLERTIEVTRNHAINGAILLPDSIENAKRMRANYDNTIKGKSSPEG